MASFHFKGIAIDGISCAVPNRCVTSESFADRFGEENVRSFIEMTGIRQTYRTVSEQTASDLCFAAAENLLRQKNIEKGQIGILIFVSQFADYINPATACVLQTRLGLSKECFAFDVNLGCSGYVYGLATAASLYDSYCRL